MKKYLHTAILLAVMVLFASFRLNAQGEANNQRWFCWEETVDPALIDDYLNDYKEVLELIRQEGFPVPIITWSSRSMVYEWWSPVTSLDDVSKIEAAWTEIVRKWGEEKYGAFARNLLSTYSKECTILGDLTYMPADPKLTDEERIYSRWIEVYLKPGTEDEFVEAVKWINQERVNYGIDDYVVFAIGGMGYEGPCFLVMYTYSGRNAYEEYFESMPGAYMEKYQEYLKRIRKLFRKPPAVLDSYLLWDLSYTPE